MPAPSQMISWKRLLAESVAIVASILLAFALDASWESRTERLEERAELERLRSEARENIATFEGQLVGQVSQLTSADSLLAILVRQAGTSGPLDIEDNLLLSLLFAPIVEPDRAVLDALISSGRLRLVSDPLVRERIATLDAKLADTRAQQERAREHYMNRLLPYLSQQADITSLMRNRRVDLFLADRFGPPGVFPWTTAAGETRLPNTFELRNLIGQQVLFQSEAIRASEDMIDTLQDFLALLESGSG